MKKFKLSVLFAALVSVFGLTSCLDNENDGTVNWWGFTKVNNNYGYTTFTVEGGFQFIPATTLTTTPTSQMALIYCSYDSSLLTEESTSATVNLLQDPVYLRETPCMYSSAPEASQTVSIPHITENGYDIWGANNEYLLLGINYYVKTGTTSSNWSTEKAKYQFIIYYDSSNDQGDGTLRLSLRHQITDADTSTDNWGQSYNIANSEYIYTDLSSLISEYQSVNNGASPTRIQLEYESSSSVYPTTDTNSKTTITITISMNSSSSSN